MHSRRCMLSFLISIPFFLHGYFPVILLFIIKSGTAELTVTDQLMTNLVHGGASLWPYCSGVLCGFAASSILPDRYGRRACILLSSGLLSLLLLLLTLAPSALVGSAGTTAAATSLKDMEKGESIIAELKVSLMSASNVTIFGTFSLGLLVSLLFQCALMYRVETSKSSQRGFDISKCTRGILYGVIVAGVNATIFPPIGTSNYSSVDTLKAYDRLSFHVLEFRWYYAIPLVLSFIVSAGMLLFPESPYWLLAQRTPTGTLLISASLLPPDLNYCE